MDKVYPINSARKVVKNAVLSVKKNCVYLSGVVGQIGDGTDREAGCTGKIRVANVNISAGRR